MSKIKEFTTKEEAEAAQESVFERVKAKRLSQGYTSDEQGLIGRKNGVLTPDSQRTTAWDTVQNLGGGKWGIRSLYGTDFANPIFFNETSPWNTKVGARQTSALTDGVLSQLLSLASWGLNLTTWTPKVFYADNTTPTQTLSWTGWHIEGVPIPDGMLAAIDELEVAGDLDRAVVIIKGDLVYNILKATNEEGVLTCSAACVHDLTKSGWWDNASGPWGGRAGCGSFGGGLIMEYEIDDGYIPHALCAGFTKDWISTSAVLPANTSDGLGTDPEYSVDMGTRLQLNPALTRDDLEALGVLGDNLIVTTAMQEYGVYIVDSVGVEAAPIYCESGGASTNLFPTLDALPKELFNHLLIVEPPESIEFEGAIDGNVIETV